MAVKLRPSQLLGCKAIYNCIQEGNRRVIVQMATGAGKTVTGSDFIVRMLKHLQTKTGKPQNCLWIAHRDELLDQAEEAFHRVDPNVKVTRWDSTKKDPYGQVVVAMIGSCRKLRGKFTFVVVDEAHHLAAEDDEEGYTNQYTRLLKRVEWEYLLGLTATPERMDERPLGFDKVAYRLPFVELVKQHRLAKPIWVEMRTNRDFQLQVRKGEFTSKSLAKLDEPERNKKIVEEWMKNKDKYGKTIIFAVSVDHCFDLQQEFYRQWADCPVEVITGATKTSVRDETVRKFKEGPPSEPKVLINCEAFIEGFDVPTTKSVFLARPTMSKTFWMQMVGRGARIVSERFDIAEADIVSCTPVGSDGVHRYVFSNGTQYFGEEISSADGVKTLELHTDDEFYLVNIMDDITKYGSLVEEWQMDLRELTADEVDAFEDKKLLRQKKLTLQILKDKKEIEPGDLAHLTDARIVDVIGVLQVSTYYQKRMSIPIDPDRYNCIRRLRQYAQNECFSEEKGELGNSYWHFNTEKYKDAYSHCVLKGEFPFTMFERLRVAFYLRFVQQREKVEYSGDHKYYDTWKYIPLIELTPESRKQFLDAEIREAEAARTANEEFNKAYETPETQAQLWEEIKQIAQRIARESEKAHVDTRALHAVLPRSSITKIANRRVNVLCDEEVTNWRMMTAINKVGNILTLALQEILDDPTALVRVSARSVNIDQRADAVETSSAPATVGAAAGV